MAELTMPHPVAAPSSRTDAPGLPYSLDAERAVLGGLLVGQDEALMQVRDVLSESDFFRHAHRDIYRAVCVCAEKHIPYDAVTLGDWFSTREKADAAVDGAYLVDLVLYLNNNTAGCANIRHYADIVREKARLRTLIDLCQVVSSAAGNACHDDTETVIASAAASFADMARGGLDTGGLRLAKTGLPAAWDELRKCYEGEIGGGLVPPWKSVEAKIPVLDSGDLMIIAARPGVGKTANAMQWAVHAAQSGRNTAVFSLEMGTTQLLTRMLSHLTGIPQTRMRQKCGLADDEWGKLNEATHAIKRLPLAIDDSGGLTVEHIRVRALRMHAKVEGGLGLVVIDYLQLVRPSERKSSNSRNDEIAHISRELKLLARELKCPVIALSQLNRQIESRVDKTPGLSDLRDSGAIEQDADIISFLYRDDYYKSRLGHDGETDGACPNLCRFIIAKNRHGETGMGVLLHRLECSTFDDGSGVVLYRPKPERFRSKAAQLSSAGSGDYKMQAAGH